MDKTVPIGVGGGGVSRPEIFYRQPREYNSRTLRAISVHCNFPLLINLT